MTEDLRYYINLLEMRPRDLGHGLWIHPATEKVIRVDTEHHEYILNHPEEFGYDFDPFTLDDIRDLNYMAIDDGWVRVLLFYTQLVLNGKSASIAGRALRILVDQNIVNLDEITTTSADFGGRQGYLDHEGTEELMHNPSKAVRLLSKNPPYARARAVNEDIETRDPIDELIKNSKYTKDDEDIATTGLCGTFALALFRHLKSRGIAAKLVLFHDADDDPWNSWAHVGVNVGDRYYDIRGRIDPNKVHYEFATGDVFVTDDEDKIFAELKRITKEFKGMHNHWDGRRYNKYARRCEKNWVGESIESIDDDDWYDDAPMKKPKEQLPYGFWITAWGEQIPVIGRQDHASHTLRGTVAALEDGWIRITCAKRSIDRDPLWLYVEISPFASLAMTTITNFSDLCNYLDDTYLIDGITLESGRGSSSIAEYYSEDGNCVRKAVSWLMSKRKATP
jgi:hypothetical protein